MREIGTNYSQNLSSTARESRTKGPRFKVRGEKFKEYLRSRFLIQKVVAVWTSCQRWW